MAPFGFQLYSARSVPSLAAFLPRLSAFGYTHVEGFGGAYGAPERLRVALDAAKLTMPSGHFSLADLRDDFDSCAQIATTLGMHTMVAPFLEESERPVDADGYKELARRLSVIGARCADAGFVFAWHNHAFEIAPLADDSVGLDVILTEAPDLMWEADLAWVIRGGGDTDQWLDRYGTRIQAVHVKDLAPEGENAEQEGWADLGAGLANWPTLIHQVRKVAPDALLIAEHDAPPEPRDFAEHAIAAFERWG